jgi:hypothetical protein
VADDGKVRQKAESANGAISGDLAGGKSGQRGLSLKVAWRGKKQGKAGLRDCSWQMERAALPYPRCCTYVVLLQMHQALQLHHLHQGGVQREEEVFFLFFLLDEEVGAGRRGLLQMHRILQLHQIAPRTKV